MISGAHIILFTPAAEVTREFLRDALGFEYVDACPMCRPQSTCSAEQRICGSAHR